MPLDRLEPVLARELRTLERSGRRKGAEQAVTGIVPAAEGRGPRVTLAGEGERGFLRMVAAGRR